MLNRDFCSFREKFIVEDINGTSTTYIKWITTWKYILKQKKNIWFQWSLILSAHMNVMAALKKLKTLFLDLYSQTCFYSHCGILKNKAQVFVPFSLSRQKPWHEGLNTWFCDLECCWRATFTRLEVRNSLLDFWFKTAHTILKIF